jgi:hypothetical protein
VVEWQKIQRFEDHLRPRPQGTEVAGVPIHLIYIPARAPRSWLCASQWGLVESSARPVSPDSIHQSPLASTQPGTRGSGRYIYETDGNSSHFSTLRTRTEMVLKTLDFLPFNHLMRLVAQEDFIILSHRESSRSYNSELFYLQV